MMCAARVAQSELDKHPDGCSVEFRVLTDSKLETCKLQPKPAMPSKNLRMAIKPTSSAGFSRPAPVNTAKAISFLA